MKISENGLMLGQEKNAKIHFCVSAIVRLAEDVTKVLSQLAGAFDVYSMHGKNGLGQSSRELHLSQRIFVL